jgi:DNA-binding transcriptional LysR family regulator
MDHLAGITAFVRVAESGGFTAAARRLSLSTTTVSDQVRALENALDVRLLNRMTRQVSLTEIGHAHYERCRQPATLVRHRFRGVAQALPM